MAEVLVVGKKISEMDLVTDIVGDEKIPTGVVGDKAVTTGQLLTYLDNNGKVQWGRIEGDIANQADLQNQFTQQLVTLQNHIQDQSNPHNVTKDQVGLGLADNTADMDKPVSTAVQEALSLKADQTYVDDSLANKTHNSLLGRDADGAHPASAVSYGSGSVGDFLSKGVSIGFEQAYAESIGGYPLHAELILLDGTKVKSIVSNNIIDPNLDMTGWVEVNNANQIRITADKYQSDKNSLNVDLLDFIPKSEWESIKNGTSAYDCTPSLVQAVATGKKITIGQSGTYKLKTAYVGVTDFELEATASDVVLDGNDNTANYVLQNSGSVTKLTTTLSENPSRYAVSVTINDVSGLKAGDWLCFYCPTDFSYSGWREIYRAGEWKQVQSIVGNTVWFTKPFYDSYADLTLELYKLNSVTCKLKNVKLLRTNGLSGFAKFSLSSNAGDENVQLDLKTREGILYDRCVAPVSKFPSGVNIGTGTGTDNDYGIVHANCQHARVLNADLYARRHAIALGGGNGICSVPVSDFRCYDSVLSADLDTAVGAADMHGNIRDSSYEDCIIYGGTNIGGGEDCYYKRCKIFSDAKGVCGYGREIIGGNMGWVDCEYHSNGNPQPTGQAVVSFGGNDVTTITEKTKKDVTIEVSGKVFGGKDYGSAVSLAKIRNRGTSQKINVVLDGLVFNNTSKFAYILNMDVVSGIANSDKIVVDNISGNMPTTNIVYTPETTAGQSYLNKPMRLQKVVGKTTITTTAGNFTASEVVNYPFSYPRRPLTMVSPRGVDGAQKNTFGGQRSVTFGVYNQGLNVMSAVVSSATAMTAGDVIEVVYSTEIREC